MVLLIIFMNNFIKWTYLLIGDLFMFLVFNKEKVYTYIVSILTVIMLFFIAGQFNSKSAKAVDSKVYSKSVVNNIIENNI